MAPAEPNHEPFMVQGQPPVFEEERKGWKGYIEWERYPEKKKLAAEVLAKYDFPVVGTIARVQQRQLLTFFCSHPSSKWCRYPRQTRY